jgi:hypothetical protein
VHTERRKVGNGWALKAILFRDGDIYLDLLRYDEVLIFWHKELGEYFQTIICDSVACRLLDDVSMATLKFWQKV